MSTRTFFINGREYAVEESDADFPDVSKLPLPEHYAKQLRWQEWIMSRPEKAREQSVVTGGWVTWENGHRSNLTNNFTFQLAVGTDLMELRRRFDVLRTIRLPFAEPIYLGTLPASWSGDDHPEIRIRRMIESRLVVFAEPEFIDFVSPWHFAPSAKEVPKDEREYMQRWQWGPDGLNVAAVSAKRSGLGQTVGVIDLAFQTDHEDLHEGIADSYRVVGDEESRAGVWGYYHPWEHGTFCAGLVAARRNGPGVVGVAPNARLVLVGLDMLSQPRLAWALKLCLQSQVQVISCSLKPCTSEDSGAGSCQDWMAVGTVLEKALGEVAQARSGKGVCLFWATNDAGTDVANDPIARREEIFAIGCLDQEHSHAGATGEKVYLAPGHNLRSTVARPGGGTYETHEGRHTSYATPCAAGVAALLLEQDSTRSVAEIHRILRSSCRKVEGSNSRGAIDAAIALKGSASAFLDPTGQ